MVETILTLDHEREIREKLLECFKTNGLFVDVGAFDGLYCLEFAKKAGRIIALEPRRDMAERLRKNLSSLSIPWQVVEKAASEFDGTLTLYTGKNLGWDSLLRTDYTEKVGGEVEVVRLDTLLDQERVIGALKIDVEGEEFRVLMGAKETLRKCDLVLVEVHPWVNTSEEVKGLLPGFSFSEFSYGACNYVLAKKQGANMLPGKP